MSKSIPIANNKHRHLPQHSANIYKIGSYELLLDHQIGVGAYSAVYIGRCLDNKINTKYSIGTKMVHGVQISNAVAIKKVIMKGLSFKNQKITLI